MSDLKACVLQRGLTSKVRLCAKAVKEVTARGAPESQREKRSHAKDLSAIVLALEEISNLPLFDGNTALIRSLKWLADSKCAEQNQCRSSSISDEPIVAVKITQEQLHVDGASSLDLAGDHLSDLYAHGGRDAAWMMEFARLTVSARSAIRNSRSVQYARTYLPLPCALCASHHSRPPCKTS